MTFTTAPRTPILGRFFIAALVFVSSAPLAAHAGVLTEDEVIRLARERDPNAAVAAATVAAAEAQELGHRLYPNPVLAWDREHYPGADPLAESEDTLSISVPIDLWGPRPVRRALARSEVAAARAGAVRSRSAAVTDALAIFYAAVAAERRVEIARHTVERLDEAARVLGRRHEEGTVSGYELSRLELEAELAHSELREAAARAELLRAELAVLLGLEPAGIELRGDLAVTGERGAPADAPQRALARPSLDLLRSSVTEARAARERADRAWVPTVSLTGGLRVGAAEETRYGYVAGISLAIPIFSRGQEVRAEADASSRLAQGRVEAAERSARITSMRAVAELALASAELARFDEATGDRVERLVRAAESGYREGQRSVVELLDAQRALERVALRRLELALAGKRAELAVRAAGGEFE